MSAKGMKGDVNNTPKCTRLNCILAPQSCLQCFAGHSLVTIEIFRADFVDYAKGSKAVKALLEKEGRPATPGSNRFLDLQVSLAPFRSKYCQKKWLTEFLSQSDSIDSSIPNTLSKLPSFEPLRLL